MNTTTYAHRVLVSKFAKAVRASQAALATDSSVNELQAASVGYEATMQALYDALAAPQPTPTPPEAKPCFMCHGAGWHWMAWAGLAGVEPPKPQKMDCTQCSKPAVKIEVLASQGQPVEASLLADAAKWLHAAYDRPPQSPECVAMLARIDRAVEVAAPVAPTSQEDEREAFNKLHRRGGNPPGFRSWSKWNEIEKAAAWEAWQARAALTAAKPEPTMTDSRIEEHVAACGARWDGSHWLIEDADLHPMVRSFMAPQPEPITDAQIDAAVVAWFSGGRLNDDQWRGRMRAAIAALQAGGSAS